MIGPVTITLPDRTQMQVVGEIISEHFAVTPLIDQDKSFTGEFIATHLTSGAAVGREGLCIAHATAVAQALTAQRVDWLRTYDDLAGDAEVVAQMSKIVSRISDDCEFAISGGCVGTPDAGWRGLVDAGNTTWGAP